MKPGGPQTDKNEKTSPLISPDSGNPKEQRAFGHGLGTFLYSFIILLGKCLTLPFSLRTRLKSKPLETVLDDLEQEALDARPIFLPAKLIRWVAKKRIQMAFSWRKNPCLLGGLLLWYLFNRARISCCFHLGCNLGNSKLMSHCWISSIEFPETKFLYGKGNHKEIYKKDSRRIRE